MPAPWPPNSSSRVSRPRVLSQPGVAKSWPKLPPTAPEMDPTTTMPTTQAMATVLRRRKHQEPRRANIRYLRQSCAGLRRAAASGPPACASTTQEWPDRNSVDEGKGVYVRVNAGGRRTHRKKKEQK